MGSPACSARPHRSSPTRHGGRGHRAVNAAILARTRRRSATSADTLAGFNNAEADLDSNGIIPAPSVSVSGGSFTEGNTGLTPAFVTVTLSGPAQGPVSLAWATQAGTAAAGTDYVTASGTLLFVPGGSMTFQIALSVIGDTVAESNETFTVKLSSATNATIGTSTATVTIVDDDGKPTVSLAGTSLSGAEQGQVPIVFTITRGPNLTGPLTVNLGWTGTATFGTDYAVTVNNGASLSANWATLTVPDGVASVTLTAKPAEDTVIENAETVILTLGASSSYTISGGTSQTGTIADNDKPTVNVANLSQLEGNGGTSKPTSFVVTVTLSAPAPYAITVMLATAATPTPLPAGTSAATAGTDYQTATFTVTFAAGQTSATVTVLVVGDKTKESNEVFNVNVTSPGGAIAGTNGTVTIQDDDGPLNATAVGTTANASSTAPSVATLASTLALAEQWWIANGASPARFAGVTVVLGDLPGTLLALTAGSVITIDVDAAGWGWSTETTPVADRIDLVSVLLHELGHVLGLDDTISSGVMDERLAPGVRLVPTKAPRLTLGSRWRHAHRRASTGGRT